MAVETASLRLSELAIGIGPFVIGPVVERKVGVGAFAAMALDADWRDAAWAERHGLYARVFNSVSALDAAVEIFAHKLAASNPEALEHIKRASWAGTDHWPTLLEERATLSGRLVLSKFTRDAISAFAARNK
jgi:methylglutaconyl-CoA hydratase